MSIKLDTIEKQQNFLKEKFNDIIKEIETYSKNNLKLLDEHKKNLKNILSNEKIDFSKFKTINEKVTYLAELEEKVVQENIRFTLLFRENQFELIDKLILISEHLEKEQKLFGYKNKNVDLNKNKGLYNSLKSFGKKIINNNLSKYNDPKYISIENKLDVLKNQLSSNNFFKTELSKKLRELNLIIAPLKTNIQTELSLRKEDIEAASKNGGEILEPKSQLYKEVNDLNFINKTILFSEFINDNLSPESFDKLINGISNECDEHINNLAKDISNNKETLINKITKITTVKDLINGVKGIKNKSDLISTLTKDNEYFKNEQYLFKWNNNRYNEAFTKIFSTSLSSVSKVLKKITDVNINNIRTITVSTILGLVGTLSYQNMINPSYNSLASKVPYAEKSIISISDSVNKLTDKFSQENIYNANGIIADNIINTKNNLLDNGGSILENNLKYVKSNYNDLSNKYNLYSEEFSNIISEEIKPVKEVSNLGYSIVYSSTLNILDKTNNVSNKISEIKDEAKNNVLTIVDSQQNHPKNDKAVNFLTNNKLINRKNEVDISNT